VKRRLTGVAVGACLAACGAVAADALGTAWGRPSAAGFESVVGQITRGRLCEMLFLAIALLAAALGTCALIQIVRDRRRRGVAFAIFGIAVPWLGRAILDGVLRAG